MKVSTLLLDLDGTLSTMDTDLFTKTYLLDLSKKLSKLIDIDKFFPLIMASTEFMIRSQDDAKTNIEVFLEHFSKATGVGKDTLWPTFIDFYTNEFSKFGHLVKPHPISDKLVKEAVAQGYTIAIACNPVMPKVAILQRIKWAGLEDKDLAFIPSIEGNHFCKPNPKFFLEITKNLGKKPEECLMVGNEVKEDMTAKRVGIKTYLITEEYNNNVECDYQGQLQDLYTMISEGKL